MGAFARDLAALLARYRAFLTFAHRAAAAFFASARRRSGDTPAQRALAPFFPPSRPQARITSNAASVAESRFIDFAIVTSNVPSRDTQY